MRHLHAKAALVLAAVLPTISACGLVPAASEQRFVPVQVLDEQGQALKAQFNKDKGKVRLLFVVDPQCATCLRGLADLNRDLLSKSPAAAAVYVVHLPVVGGTREHIAGAASLVNAVGPLHYWDPKAGVGEKLTDVLSLRSKGEPALAWDVFLAYGPDATWEDKPPQPRVAMHQLSPVDPNPNVTYLDSKLFAQRVNGLLARPRVPAEQG